MDILEQIILVSSSVQNIYQFCEYSDNSIEGVPLEDQPDSFITVMNKLSNFVDPFIEKGIITIISQNRNNLDLFISQRLNRYDDYHLQYIEVHLLILTYKEVVLNNERLQYFLEQIMKIFSEKNESVGFEKTLIYAELIVEHLLNYRIELSEKNIQYLMEIKNWKPREDGDMYPFKHHSFKISWLLSPIGPSDKE